MNEKKHLSRRDFLKLTSLTAAGGMLASCAPSTKVAGEQPGVAPKASEPVAISMTFWGSPKEKAGIEAAAEKFNNANSGINVTTNHFPNDAYIEKVTTLIAGGTPPDVAYLFEAFCENLAIKGQILDHGPYFKADPVMKNYMNNLNPYYGGICVGTGIASEFQVVFYDKGAFNKAGIDTPPADPSKSWDIHQYLEAAKMLTLDSKGRNATDKNFDKDNINTYGMTFPWWAMGPIQMGYSNGGKFTSEDGMKLTLDTPEMIDALQIMQDSIWKYHVSPTPSVLSSNNMTVAKLMETGKVAMDFNGHWNFLEYPGTNVELGVAPLPYMKELVSFMECSPVSVMKATKHINESFEWYKYMHDPAACDLFKEGLWAPVTSDYYENPELTDSWLKGKPGVYPEEAKTVFVEYVYKMAKEKCWYYTTKNYSKIETELLAPAFSAVAANEKTAEQAYQEAVAKSPSYMQGIWPDLL